MYGPFDLVDKVKRYFWFSQEEWKSILITILALTFIIGFNDGRKTGAIDSFWFYNLFICLIVVVIVVLVHLAGQRIVGLDAGFRVEYKVWWYGIIIGLVMALVTRGNIWVILPGGILIHHLSIHRLGYFRYGTNTLAMAMTALAGPLANILLATFLKTLEIWFNVPVSSVLLLDKLIVFSWVYAIWSLVPIPPLNGALILFKSRLMYAFIFGTIGGYAVLVMFGIYSFIFAFIIGAIFWLLFYILFERGAWSF